MIRTFLTLFEANPFTCRLEWTPIQELSLEAQLLKLRRVSKETLNEKIALSQPFDASRIAAMKQRAIKKETLLVRMECEEA